MGHRESAGPLAPKIKHRKAQPEFREQREIESVQAEETVEGDVREGRGLPLGCSHASLARVYPEKGPGSCCTHISIGEVKWPL